MVQIISSNTRIWLHGLLAAAITSFSSAASGFLLLPTVFNFSHDGLINMVKVAAVPTAVAVFAYLKQSPLPSLTLQPGDTLNAKNPVMDSSGRITADSATLVKAPAATESAPAPAPGPSLQP